MSVSVVNGFVCFNCTDTEKAQKGVDPANPTNDPTQNKSTQTKKDEAHALAKIEATRIGQVSASSQTASGQSGANQSTGQSGPPVPALLAPGVGDLLDVTA